MIAFNFLNSLLLLYLILNVLLASNYLLILKILLVTLSIGSEVAILAMKTFTGTRLWS